MAKQLAFYFDSSVCIGCKACQVACQDKNDLSADIMWRRVFRYGGGNWVKVGSYAVPNNMFRYFVSISCQHCQEPECVKVCPTTAMTKRDDGTVVIDSEKCIGCRYCEWACPYGAPHFDEAAGIMTKCNFCQDLLAKGENPACVDSCPMRALDFGELEDLQAKYGTLNAIEPLPSGEYTNPSLVITAHPKAELVGEKTGSNIEPAGRDITMNTNEWALIIFTVVMQMAVGSFVILGGVHFFAARRNGIDEADKLSDRALLAIGPVVVFGLLVTLLHLGNPINAPRAIANIGSSWLSREILFSLLFCIGGAVFAFLQWRKLSTPTVRNALAVIVALIGIVLVFSMSMVYRLFSVPAWDTFATQLTFFITTFLLGSLAMGAAFVANFWYIRRKNMDSKNVQYTMVATCLRWIALITIALLGLQFIVMPLYLSALGMAGTPAAAASIALIAQQQGVIFALRLVLLFVGAGLLAVFVYSMASSENKLRVVSNLAYLAFALVLFSEIIGRYLFYASMVKIGI